MSWVSKCYFSLIGCGPVAAYGPFFKKYWLKLNVNGFCESVSCSIVSTFLRPHGLEVCQLFLSLEAHGFLYRCWLSLLRASQVALVVKHPPANAGNWRDVGSIPGSGRYPGGGHGNPLKLSCLENSVNRGAWQATANRVTKSRTWLKRLSMAYILIKWLFGVMFIGIQWTLGVL